MISIIAILFNITLFIEYVPDAFGKSVTTPIPKVTSGKALSSVDNYRGISINPIISKLFEQVLLHLYQKYMVSSRY